MLLQLAQEDDITEHELAVILHWCTAVESEFRNTVKSQACRYYTQYQGVQILY